MPMAPPKPCPRCGRLHCLEHQVAPWRGRQASTPRLRGRGLQVKRAQLFALQPWCATCATSGRRTRATIRDHIVPLAEGGADDDTNVQGLCQTCSDRKTQAEAARGVRRDW